MRYRAVVLAISLRLVTSGLFAGGSWKTVDDNQLVRLELVTSENPGSTQALELNREQNFALLISFYVRKAAMETWKPEAVSEFTVRLRGGGAVLSPLATHEIEPYRYLVVFVKDAAFRRQEVTLDIRTGTGSGAVHHSLRLPSETFGDTELVSGAASGSSTTSGSNSKVASDAAATIYRMGDPRITSLPQRISAGEAPYPEEAKRAGIQGTVTLKGICRRNGSLTDLKVIKGLGHGLDQAAIRTISKTWRYKPALIGNTPVDVEIPFIIVRFVLR
jgi:TonB family protein